MIPDLAVVPSVPAVSIFPSVPVVPVVPVVYLPKPHNPISCQKGSDLALTRKMADGTYYAYFPFASLTEESKMTPYREKLISCQKGSGLFYRTRRSPRDSTLKYSPRGLTFGMGRKCCPLSQEIYKKLLVEDSADTSIESGRFGKKSKPVHSSI